RRSDRRVGKIRQAGRSRRLRRGHARNGRADIGARATHPQSEPEDHLRLRLCGRRLPEEFARARAVRFFAKTIHAQTTRRRRKRNVGGVNPTSPARGRGRRAQRGGWGEGGETRGTGRTWFSVTPRRTRSEPTKSATADL